MKQYISPFHKHDHGFSLIELMVALVIGLIVSLAVFAALNTFEGRKRTTTAINDIDQVGNFAAYTLDKWVRNAGSGFTQNTEGAFDYLLCKLTASKNSVQILPRTAALPAPFAAVSTGVANEFRLAPLLILPNQTTPNVSGTTSDVLVIMSGASGQSESATPFISAPTATHLTVYSKTGFAQNDLILVARKGGLAECMLQQIATPVAAIAGPPATEAKLPLSGTYFKDTINSISLVSPNFCSTALTPAAARRCTALNLGNMSSSGDSYVNPPSFLVIGVGDNNTLFGYDLLQSQSATAAVAQASFPIADSVFEMHALYGIDTNNDNKVDSWVAPSGSYAPTALTAADGSGIASLCKIKAVRIGLITRTALMEKDNVNSGSISLFSDLSGAGLNITRTVTGDNLKYRYKTIDTTIPLRNVLNIACPTA